MPGVFICYRREDASPYAGRLYDHISARFGAQRVFMDIDTIRPGDDFVQAMSDRVAACDVLIAVIGKNWLSCVNSRGQRRLDDPRDYVRIEIASALQRNVRVIPALFEGAAMPDARQLPTDLAPLARRNAIAISNTMFRPSVERLIQSLEETVRPNPMSFGRMLRMKPKPEQVVKQPRTGRTILPALRWPSSVPPSFWPVLGAGAAFFFLQMMLGDMNYAALKMVSPLLHGIVLMAMLSLPFFGGSLERRSAVQLAACWVAAIFLKNLVASGVIQPWPLPQYAIHYRIPPSSGLVLVIVEGGAALLVGVLFRFVQPAIPWRAAVRLAQIWTAGRLMVWFSGNVAEDGLVSIYWWAFYDAIIGASTLWMARQSTPAPRPVP
jgi:hypothetical protein